MSTGLSFNGQKPVYNIKAAARLVGLLPVTIRAWERRYGLPSPARGSQGYRLYSEYDIRTLLWLKGQVDSGMSIRQAAEHLNHLRSQGVDPVNQEPAMDDTLVTLSQLSQELLASFHRFDSNQAQAVLRKSLGLFSVDQVMIELIQPVMVAVGEEWANQEESIAVEHFATQMVIQQLMSMLASIGYPTRTGVILAGCLPGEEHQIGLLLLTVLLRWRGYDVRFLGPNLSFDDLGKTLTSLRPSLLLLSATSPEAVKSLEDLSSILHQLPAPAPQIIVGGQAFQNSPLPPRLPFTLLTGNPDEIIRQIDFLMRGKHH